MGIVSNSKSTPIEEDESRTPDAPPIWVVGLTAAGAFGLSAANMRRVHQADLLVGGNRHLEYFPAFGGEKLAVTKSVAIIAEEIRIHRATGKTVVVLASGDPLCYGIGSSLLRYFPPDQLEITPAPSSFQLAFAALSEPWNDAALLSAHGRLLEDVVHAVAQSAKSAILTDNDHTPSVIAAALIEAGVPADSPCAICENLGGLDENVVRTTLTDSVNETFSPLNVFVVWNNTLGDKAQQAFIRQGATSERQTISNHHPSSTIYHRPLPDDAFSTSANQITKREVRALALAELALGPGEVMWDIGAGSGAVAIEAARSQPSASLFAVEKREAMVAHARANIQRHGVDNISLAQGMAPSACASWPDPDAVFVGGSGGQLEAIIRTGVERLKPNGRLVINLATIENLVAVCKLLPDAQVNQVQISRGVPILEMLRFEALNPVFMVIWRKQDE